MQVWCGSVSNLSVELLLLHQVVHHGEVLVAQTLLAQRLVHLVGQRSQWDGRVGGFGHPGGQAKILGDQGRGETAGVVPVGGGSGADAGHRVVDLGCPAAAGGGVDDLGEDVGMASINRFTLLFRGFNCWGSSGKSEAVRLGHQSALHRRFSTVG